MEKIRQAIVIAAFAASFAMCDYAEEYMTEQNPLPIQAAVADVAGIGTLGARTETNILINVTQHWFSVVQTNIISVPFPSALDLPGGTTNYMFFLTRPRLRKDQTPIGGHTEPARTRYSYMFDMEEFRAMQQPDDPLYLLNGVYSWIPVTEENAALVNWCSNLVYSSQVSLNLQTFYELIRDGYQLNPETSRIYRESMHSFMRAVYFMPTNFMQQVWETDTNLIGKARADVNNAYWMKTRTFMPPPSTDGE
jgi:hypothetical protein